MKITFLVPNMGGSSLGFATAYARALADQYAVDIVGPDIWGGGVLPIYRSSFDYKVVPADRLYRLPDYLWQARRLEKAVEGDVVAAIKATPQTLGIALRKKRRRGSKVVACLDEWDGALMARRSWAERCKYWARHWNHPLEENYYPLMERQLSKVDLVISTSRFLQRKFGGKLVRMCVDTDKFKPLDEATKLAVRGELGLSPEHRVVVFGGFVRPHKGVEQILGAMARTGDSRLRLLVVGPITETLSRLMDGPHGPTIHATGEKPIEEMPRWLGAGDWVVLPMANDLLAQSQVPCKVFEAMSMGLPVIAGAISDLPEILEGAGEVYPIGENGRLADVMKQWLERPEIPRQYGQQARHQCLAKYSFQAMKKDLGAAMAPLLDERNDPT